ncbi:MAG: hypothetical protein WCG47_06540 [Dermatophilaceae bacterium]
MVEVVVPAEASPAAADLVCWLFAAFPANRRGRVNVRLAAPVLGVSQSTVRRWILVSVGRTETWRQSGAITRLVLGDAPGARRVTTP